MSVSSYAASGNITPPFDIGSAWNICQGYKNTRGTHVNTSSLSLDITGGPGCDSSGNGKNVRSPFAGVVSWYSAGSGSLCVSDVGSRSVMLTHIDNTVAPGTIVTNGQIVGSIAAPYQRQNNGVSHLHFQAWSTTGCGDSTKRVPFDAANSMRICGAQDMTTDGPNPYNNGTWSGTSFIAEPCGTANPPVYRMFSNITKKHLFTADSNEVLTLRGSTWNYEGVAYTVNSLTSCAPGESVHRFYSGQLKTHLYTNDENEKNYIMANFPTNLWKYEGVAFCASSTQVASTKPVYRFYSEQLKSHLFTVDENEKNTIIGWNDPSVWRYEGVAYYASSSAQ